MNAPAAKRAVRVPGAPTDTQAATAQPETKADATVSADMPNAIDIDPAEIKAPVLTKQGWVCPLEKPNPNAPR